MILAISREGEQSMYVDCVSTVFNVWRERKIKQNLHITRFHDKQELNPAHCWLSDHIYNFTKKAEYCVIKWRFILIAACNFMVNNEELVGTTKQSIALDEVTHKSKTL
jgi:hypothetical protein